MVYKNNLSVIHGPFFILFGSENTYFDTNIAYDKDWAFTRWIYNIRLFLLHVIVDILPLRLKTPYGCLEKCVQE